jgi:hypothetical protein
MSKRKQEFNTTSVGIADRTEARRHQKRTFTTVGIADSGYHAEKRRPPIHMMGSLCHTPSLPKWSRASRYVSFFTYLAS